MLLPVWFFTSCQKTGKRTAIDPWAAYRKAYTLLSTNKDSAFLYFNQLAENSKDKQQVALAYYNMALLQSNAGDHYGAQESLTLSLKSLDEHWPEDRNYLAIDYNELSMACFNLQDYAASLNYSDNALKYAADSSLLHYILNNKGNALQKLKRYDEAISTYSEVLRLTANDSTEHPKALTNVAVTKWLKDPGYNAAPDLHTALTIRLKKQDTWGQNSSYAHLADFYSTTKPDSALFYARKMLLVADQLQSPDDKLEAIQKLILFSHPANIKSYYLRYQALNDSISYVRKAAKNQFALIRYGVEKNKTENLKLQKANTEKKYQLGFIILLLLTGIPAMIIWYRKRKQRLQLEADNRIRQDRLQLSQRVHDVVANGIYRVMNEVDYSDELDKNYLLGQLDFMYEQSRKISQDEDPGLQEEFSEKLQQLVNAFKSDSIKLALSGNEPELWEAVNDKIKDQLELVLQELLVNMSKHSHASQAIIDFELMSGQLLVSYRDNGVGFPNNIRKGKGLQNTENRIRVMGGELIFGTEEKPGARLHISIPIN